jgi:hypothetical protein
MLKSCFIAPPRVRARTCQSDALSSAKRGSAQNKDRGAPIGRVHCANWAASRRPAYAAIFKHRAPLTRASRRDWLAKLTTPGFHPRRVLEDPRGRIALLLPAAAGRGQATPPVFVPPASSGAALLPTWRDGPGHASLMGKRRAECNGGARRGDSEGSNLLRRSLLPPLPNGERDGVRGKSVRLIGFKAPSPAACFARDVLSPRGEEEQASSPTHTSSPHKERRKSA